jgi:DeoR family transcriptional regulator of aga operon
MPQSRNLRRQEKILELLNQRGEMTGEELAAQLSVSIWTIRRDLTALAARGVLDRRHGGAAAAVAPHLPAWDTISLQQAAATNLEVKQRIGWAVAAGIPSGAHVALTGGSTTLAVARALKAQGFGGEIVTNALDIAIELAGLPQLSVVCTGGEVQPRYHTLAGAVTERVLKLHFFDYAVIGVSGFDLRYGFTVNSQVEAAIADLIAAHARTVIVAADRSKLGRVAFAAVLEGTPPHLLATDGPLPPDYARQLRAQNVPVMTAV